jgi:hypothetical protein
MKAMDHQKKEGRRTLGAATPPLPPRGDKK